MADVGIYETVDLARTEGDTDDVVVHLTNADGTDATVIGWTAILSVGTDADTPLAPPKTYNGTGVAAGLIPINMNGFDVPIGSYKYDIRITDTVTGDTPVRVYFKGKFKVTARIN
jgi:hypothetical protein